MISDSEREFKWVAAGEGGYQCRECGEVFGGVQGFDKHRHGPYGPSRRCLSIDDIKQVGMVKSKYGRWGMPYNKGD